MTHTISNPSAFTAFSSLNSARAGVADSQTSVLPASMLLRLLDELDYGVLLLDCDGAIQHANHLARHELAMARTVRNESGQLVARRACDTAELHRLARRAGSGQRSMVQLGDGDAAVSLAFVPLASESDGAGNTVLVLFGKRQLCESVTIALFARSYGLTPAEESVLKGLCDGLEVDQIARSHKVAESTVRTQVRLLRAKTACASIRELLRKVSALPSVVPALRGMAG